MCIGSFVCGFLTSYWVFTFLLDVVQKYRRHALTLSHIELVEIKYFENSSICACLVYFDGRALVNMIMKLLSTLKEENLFTN